MSKEQLLEVKHPFATPIDCVSVEFHVVGTYTFLAAGAACSVEAVLKTEQI